MRSSKSSLVVLALFSSLVSTLGACGQGMDPNVPNRSPLAEKWQQRARASYRAGDMEDASQASDAGISAAPKDAEIRTLGARVALAKLDYAKALKLTEGLQTSDAHALRGRALWYQGDIEQAAEELEAMLRDPQVKDPWARDVAKLARRGQGRHPFAIEGGLVAAVEMPPAGPALIVPCELEGERILALVSTAVGELIVDSASRKEPAWVNLRFGDRVEVKDVPAFTQDLSGLSRQLGVPIKALLGVNLLRHIHVTFDRRGSQFVVRKSEPPAPPDGSRVPLFYVRGGGMIVRATLATKDEGFFPMLVDSSAMYPLAVDDSIFKKAGVDPTKLRSEPGMPQIRTGVLPNLRIGSFDMPQVPAMQAKDIGELRTQLDMDLGGIMGSSLLSVFRITFGDEGRFMWIEPDLGLTGMEGPPDVEGPRGRPEPLQPDPSRAAPGKDPRKGAASPPAPAAPPAKKPAPATPAPSTKPGPAAPAPPAGKSSK